MAYDEEYDMSSSEGRLGYGLISLNQDYVLVLFSQFKASLFLQFSFNFLQQNMLELEQ